MVSLRSHLAKIAIFIALIPGTCHPAGAGENSALLTGWLNAQTNFRTWSADFTQTRTLKTLTQPLTAQGHVWFATPNRFRWELGRPAQTIAVRQPDQMLIIYPRLKRAERYPLTTDSAGPWKDMMALLDAGFPRGQADLDARFKVLSVTPTGGLCAVTLQPRIASARRMMPQIQITFATNDFSLRATELTFADGSTLRNDFANAQTNPKLDDTVFSPQLDADLKIVEPLKKGSP
jgi:outer membrane lipoprotein-sorting protein